MAAAPRLAAVVLVERTDYLNRQVKQKITFQISRLLNVSQVTVGSFLVSCSNGGFDEHVDLACVAGRWPQTFSILSSPGGGALELLLRAP